MFGLCFESDSLCCPFFIYYVFFMSRTVAPVGFMEALVALGVSSVGLDFYSDASFFC